ncbi:replication initiator [Glycomyces buryatensis]|uniref:replication initiator n=1 Tax=Glycomyces buryatensis TaxID=2570927 RepID=UPI001B3C16B4|nr:replication initiator [Glycomyces buryatensis]
MSTFKSSKAYCDWRSRVQAVGGCARPVKLLRRETTRTTLPHSGLQVRTTAEDRSVWVRCGTRRAAACPSCSARYEQDAFHLVRAGLVGDEPKGVPATVADRPTVFVTLTAPSFGPVHSRPGHRPCACRAWHREADPRLGSPVDPDTYDYETAVLWNNHAGALWADFTRRLRRTLAHAGGLTIRESTEVMKVSYAKVAEYQRRGQVHFHAAVRIDGPTGPGSRPPAWATVAVLTEAVRAAATATEVDAQRADRSGLILRWGGQLDVQTIATGPADRSGPDPSAETAQADRSGSAETAGGSAGAVTSGGPGTVQAVSPGSVQAGRVASYIAKYATKSTGVTDGIDQAVTSEADIAASGASPHAQAMMRTALHLAESPHLADLRLDRWAHMLGYRGHFLTKSRAFSTTFAALRGTRAAWQIAQHQLDMGGPDVLVDVDWSVIGFGYRTAEEHHVAAQIAESIATRAKDRRTGAQGRQPLSTTSQHTSGAAA